MFSCGGRLEYLHRCSASRKRRWKGDPVPGGILIGLSFSGFDTRPTTLVCKNIIVTKSKEVKTGWQIWQNLLRKAMAEKVLFCQWWWWWWWWQWNYDSQEKLHKGIQWKTCCSVAWSTTDLTWNCAELYQRLRDETPTPNCIRIRADKTPTAAATSPAAVCCIQ
jgi:hypothetical protein